MEVYIFSKNKDYYKATFEKPLITISKKLELEEKKEKIRIDKLFKKIENNNNNSSNHSIFAGLKKK